MTHSDTGVSTTFSDLTTEELQVLFDEQEYVAEDEIITTVLLSLRLGKPLLLEGEPGSGKTELGRVLADGFDTELIRLQCYEGLTAENALYEWNYTKQLLSIQADERGVADVESDETSVFGKEFLFERPLMQALTAEGTPPVLLIDEIDRADEEFEALLLELLSDFQISVPEFGTVTASVRPIVIITSNRTRGLSDALKRRCLYLHITPPDFEKEYEILTRKVPELDDDVAVGICRAVQRLREEPLIKQPGVSETLDWAESLATLSNAKGVSGTDPTPADFVELTLGALLKESEDIERIDDELLETLRTTVRAGTNNDD